MYINFSLMHTTHDIIHHVCLMLQSCKSSWALSVLSPAFWQAPSDASTSAGNLSKSPSVA